MPKKLDPKKPVKVHIDSEFNDLNPSLSTEELAGLTRDVVECGGPRDPILVWFDGSRYLVVDGMNRVRICRDQQPQLPFKTKEIKFYDRAHAKAWIIRNQRNRRNLNPSQLAMQAAKLTRIEHEITGIPEPGSQEQTAGTPTEEAAAEFGVSPRAVQMATKVLDTGTPELVEAVERGDVRVSAAAAVAELPKARQDAIVSKGPEEIKRQASKRRERQEKAREHESNGKEKPKTVPQLFTECDSLFGKVIRMVDQIGRETGNKQARDEVADALNMAYKDFNNWRTKAKKEAKAAK